MRARAPPLLTLLYRSPQNLPAYRGSGLGPRQPRPHLSYSHGCHSLKGFVACRGSTLSSLVADRLLAASTLETNDGRQRKRSGRWPRAPQGSSQQPFLQPVAGDCHSTVVTRGRLLSLSTIDIWSQIILCCGAILVAGGSLVVPGLCPQTPVRLSLSSDNQKCLQTLPGVPWWDPA